MNEEDRQKAREKERDWWDDYVKAMEAVCNMDALNERRRTGIFAVVDTLNERRRRQTMKEVWDGRHDAEGPGQDLTEQDVVFLAGLGIGGAR